jgi:crossover junction endodeoxyribonuclease RuvC
VRILGIDPGYGTLGWAVIEDSFSIAGCGAVETAPGSSMDERLLHIHRSLAEIIEQYKPARAAIEKLYFSRNTTTALDVAKAMGVAMLTIRLYGLECAEYSPSQVKRAITGYGKAGKGQVRDMITRILRAPGMKGRDDVFDALAIAACHCLCSPGCAHRRARTSRDAMRQELT